ncbi:MAG: hypothetical protein KJ601_03815, partial [Nanoarchaeota archaeon]|nr:hypothetical protein [Nanoarchaeota archaeon]
INYTIPGTLPDGTYFLNMTAEDNAGNMNETFLGNFTVDSMAPRIDNLTTVPGLPTYNNGTEQNLVVNFTSSEYPINITFYLYNSTGSVVNTSGPWTILNISYLPVNYTLPGTLPDGVYLLNMTAEDLAGNVNETFVGNFTVDSMVPRIDNLTTVPNLPIYNDGTEEDIVVNFNSSEYPIYVTFYLYNSTGSVVNTSGPWTVLDANYLPINYTIPGTFPDGVYFLNMIARDPAGNANETFLGNFTVDGTVPLIQFESPTLPSGSVVQKTWVEINVSATDIHFANITVYLYNSTSLVNVTTYYSSPAYANITNLSDGGYYYNATVYDLAGNYNKTATRTLTIGQSVPIVSLVAPAHNATDGDGLGEFTCNAISTSGLKNISIVFEGLINQTLNASGITNSSNFNISVLPDGNYTWSCIAYDIAGNRGYSANRTWYVNILQLPIYTNTSNRGNTTNFSNVPDLGNVCNGNAILDQPDVGLIQWFHCVDVRSQNFDINVNISHNNITVNFGLNPTFNSTARLKIRNLTWEDVPVLYKNGEVCPNSTCYDVEYSSNTVTFYVGNFSSYTTGVSAALAIWDSGDADMPYANQTEAIGDNVVFFANYTKTSNQNPVLGATCFINFSDKSAFMTYNTTTSYYQYNRTFAAVGNYSYNITCDKLGFEKLNLSDSIIITDSAAPNVSNLYPLAGSNYSEGFIVSINVTVNDTTGVDTVLANVTLPDGSSVIVFLNHTAGQLYFNNFTQTTLIGLYNITIIANDTYGNTNYTVKTYFSIVDSTAPIISLNTPLNNSNTSSRNVVFNYTATDNYYATMNCSVYADGAYNKSGTGVNGTPSTITINSFTDGLHSWYINCSDAMRNSNVSRVRYFTVDTTLPTFTSLKTTPDDEDGLDPNITITVYGNVTDNITSVNTVILQYKLHSSSNYTNTSMIYNAGLGLYVGYLNLSAAGVYDLRMFANDTVGNRDISNTINISVYYDRTWTRTPSTFPVKNANVSTLVTLGNLIINNTGDYAMNFSVLSNYPATTTYDTTANFTLAAKGVKTLLVKDFVNQKGIKIVTLNITASPNGNPSSRKTTGQIVVAGGQPVLSVTFTTPSADTLSVLRGATSVEFTAQVENIGRGNATNVTLFLDIPASWTVTFGATSVFFGQILPGNTEQISIEVTIPANETLGDYIVVGNVTGYNTTGGKLELLGLAFSDTVTVTVTEPASTLGGGGAGGGGGGTTTIAPSTPAGSGGGGGSSGPKVIGGLVLFDTEESFEVVRGMSEYFPIKITNVYQDATMYNVKISVDGYLAQYLTLVPDEIDSILPGMSKTIRVKIDSPRYFDREEFDLYFKITSNLRGSETITLENGEKSTRNIDKNLVENRFVKLYVLEISETEANFSLAEAEKYIQEMKDEGIPSSKVELLLEQARKAMESKDYGRARDISEQIGQARNDGFKARDLISKLRDQIALAEDKGVDVSEAKALLNLAIAAYERGDFETAIFRANDAIVTILLLSQGRLNIIWLLRTYWHYFLLLFGVLLLLGWLVRRRVLIILIKRKLEDLDKEEATIHGLMEDLQRSVFKKKEISVSEYHTQVYNYEKRLSEIRHERDQLQHKRISMYRGEKELLMLNKEDAAVVEKLRRLQDAYFNRKTINHRTYSRKKEEYSLRRQEIENSLALIERKNATKEALKEVKAHKKAAKTGKVAAMSVPMVEKGSGLKREGHPMHNPFLDKLIAIFSIAGMFVMSVGILLNAQMITERVPYGELLSSAKIPGDILTVTMLVFVVFAIAVMIFYGGKNEK